MTWREGNYRAAELALDQARARGVKTERHYHAAKVALDAVAPPEPESHAPDPAMHWPEPGGLYQHYKGGRYRVITVARLSEQRDQIVVVYESLSLGSRWARPLGMWSEPVDWPDGTRQPRFRPEFDSE